MINRNPVASALSLVVSFLGLAALFMSLDAYFIGIIQVLVYAGAVMVLFLFIIMLLDLRAETRRKINLVAIVGGSSVALAFFRPDLSASSDNSRPGKPVSASAAPDSTDDVRSVGLPSLLELQSAVPDHRRAGPGRHDRCRLSSANANCADHGYARRLSHR